METGNRGEQSGAASAAAKLTDETASAAKAVKRYQAIAQAATEELQGFVYAASHDVKEALRSVNSYSQLLVRHAPPDPELAEYAQFVTEGVRSAISILDRMNLFARIDVSPHKTSVRLVMPVQMAVLKLQPTIRDSGATVIHQFLPNDQGSEVTGNEQQLQLLFENLIGNAIQYRGEHPPRVEIASEEQDDGHQISIRDNGVGIKPEFHDLVFQSFKRLHGKEIPGIGLGLAICRKIALAHAGRIWVESDGISGSVFKVFLPF